MSEQSQKKPVSTAYLDSPYFPLPEDMGKNRKELLAMAKGNFTEKKADSLSLGEVVPKVNHRNFGGKKPKSLNGGG
ncbi:hypothetical protein P3S68_033279 [Capsicum galapagoense]